MSRQYLILILIVPIILILFGVLFFSKTKTKTVNSQSSTMSFSDQAQWSQGTNSNTNLVSTVGSVQIDNKALVVGNEIDITGATASSTGPLVGDINTPVGNHCGSGWGWPESPPIVLDSGSWTVDLGQIRSGLIHVQTYGWGWQAGEVIYQVSTDGSNWTSTAWSGLAQECGYGWDDTSISSETSFRYFRINMSFLDPSDDPRLDVFGFELYEPSSATATHTTAPTQIDGGANFWQWENFTDSKTVPANTSVTYRYRTSTDSSTWTAWVGAIGAVTSRTGDDSSNPTKYRYLQIEATLTNTDGTSTPTIDQYDIGYHTEQKPNKPTAQTAVVN